MARFKPMELIDKMSGKFLAPKKSSLVALFFAYLKKNHYLCGQYENYFSYMCYWHYGICGNARDIAIPREIQTTHLGQTK